MKLLDMLGAIAAICRFIVTLTGDREDKKSALELRTLLKQATPERIDGVLQSLEKLTDPPTEKKEP